MKLTTPILLSLAATALALPTTDLLDKRTSKYASGSKATDIASNTGCTALTVIFARGTSEASNIGSIAGPPMFKQLLSDKGASQLTLQGVEYAANAAGNANCGAAGAAAMASSITTVLRQCPDTKVVLSGYSQGACVVHSAVKQSGVDNTKIAAVVLFGDPKNRQAVGSVPSSKVLQICASGDRVCDGSGSFAITQAHLSYGKNAKQAATFIEQQAGI